MSNYTNEQRHVQKLSWIVIVGIVVTITVAVVGNLLNHSRNVNRDIEVIKSCQITPENPRCSDSPELTENELERKAQLNACLNNGGKPEAWSDGRFKKCN